MLTMNNSRKVREGFYKDVEWILPQLHATKEAIVYLAINKMVQGCVGKVDGFKSSLVVGT